MIRSGGEADHDFIGRLAVEVFSYLGDYGRIIPEWLAHAGVDSFIALEHEERVAFTMIGYHRTDGEPAVFVADLLAIAVAPSAQRRGLGRRLLDHAIATAGEARSQRPVRELRLSVAENNLRARRMFAAAGFVALPGDHGFYDRGQRALHLTRPL